MFDAIANLSTDLFLEGGLTETIVSGVQNLLNGLIGLFTGGAN